MNCAARTADATRLLPLAGLTVSAGVSPNRKLSKIAADFNKPNGQYVIDPSRDAMIAFAHALPIRKIPGVGRVTERYLQALGVETVADVYRLRGKLMLVKGEVGIDFLLRSYLGLGGTEIAEAGQRNQKGIGVERTFRETTDLGFIQTKVSPIALAYSNSTGLTMNYPRSAGHDCRVPGGRHGPVGIRRANADAQSKVEHVQTHLKGQNARGWDLLLGPTHDQERGEEVVRGRPG